MLSSQVESVPGSVWLSSQGVFASPAPWEGCEGPESILLHLPSAPSHRCIQPRPTVSVSSMSLGIQWGQHHVYAITRAPGTSWVLWCPCLLSPFCSRRLSVAFSVLPAVQCLSICSRSSPCAAPAPAPSSFRPASSLLPLLRLRGEATENAQTNA